jgi:hypothetical protein
MHTCGQTLVKDRVKTLVKPLDPKTLPITFAVFSNFHLNTSKSANTKVIRLFKGHTFHN